MDFQNREGSTGSVGIATRSEAGIDRRERLRRLALGVIDLEKDPYILKNHLGSYECRLCLTLHNTEGGYLAHTQGKKHQENLCRRAIREAALAPTSTAAASPSPAPCPKKFKKIGRPGYKMTKLYDPKSDQRGILFQIYYPQIKADIIPIHRIMSPAEQTVDNTKDICQYLVVAAEPYDTIGFKIIASMIDTKTNKPITCWCAESKSFVVQLFIRD